MPIAAIFMLIAAALLHTVWNMLLKGSRQTFITTWWTVLIGGAISLPVLLYSGLPPRHVWPSIAASVVIETIYFIILAYAYQDNDFSLIYPISRGAAPAFLAIWALVFVGEPLTRGGLGGLGLIVGGLVLVGMSNFWTKTGEKIHFKGIFLALSVSVLISLYTVVDGTAVKQTAPLPYALSIFVLLPLVISPIFAWKFGWGALADAWGPNKARLLAIGSLGIGAYGMALAAYRIAPVGYAGAIREMSVVFGALAGWKFFGESLGVWRVGGAVFIFAGILAIALWG